MDARLSAQALRDRWRGEGQVLARQVADRLVTGARLDDLGLGVIDSRIDLRGLWVVNPAKNVPAGKDGRPSGFAGDLVPWATGVHWSDLDLSHTTLPIRLQGAHLQNIRLDHAGLQAWYVCESRFEHVSLYAANLDQAVLDGNSGFQGEQLQWKPSTWTRCDFSRANLKNSPGFGRATLEDCTFVRTAWPGGINGGHDFRGAALRRCRFEGPALALRFGWTGPLRGEIPPWVEVHIPREQVGDCEVHQVSGPGIVVV